LPISAIAGGMMIAASWSLVHEAADYQTEDFGILSYFGDFFHPLCHSKWRTAFGFAIGILFIVLTKWVLDRYDAVDALESGNSAQRMFLMVIVMTLHSLTEGIGLGVSFGGQTGMKLGQFITFSLAFHNVPEGLAVGLVMAGKDVSPIRSSKCRREQWLYGLTNACFFSAVGNIHQPAATDICSTSIHLHRKLCTSVTRRFRLCGRCNVVCGCI
jgi:hypothetical protein